MLMVVLSCGVLMIEKLFVNCAFHHQPSLSSAATLAMEADYCLQLVIIFDNHIACIINNYYCHSR